MKENDRTMNQKMSKKLLACLLAATMGLTVLAGCSEQKEQPKEEPAQQTQETQPEAQTEEKTEQTPTEKLTLSDESGLPQFNNPDKDSEVAILHTSAGDIKIMFFPQYAPKAVENFLTHAKDGYYDGVSFHRVIENFMIQGGDPKGNGTGGSEKTIKGEFLKNGVNNTLTHTRGTISMARSPAYDSASSQFFICNADSTFLDGNYAAFGYVTEGMEVVDAITEYARALGYTESVPKADQPIIESIRRIK